MTPCRVSKWVAVGGAVAGLHVARWGYVYGSGDHDDVLPPILARLDPSLFAQDWFVQTQLDGVTIRTAFQLLVAALAGLTGLPGAVAVLHVAVLGVVGAGVFEIARGLGATDRGAALGALLACVAVPTWTLGGNAVVYSILAPESVGWALAVPAVALFAHERRLAAGALLGVTAWMHPLVGGLVTIVLGAAWSVQVARDRGRGVGSLLAFGAMAAAVAAPVVGPILLRQSAEAGAALGLDPFVLFARIRFPHHLYPPAFHLGSWARFGLLFATGGAAFVWLGRSSSAFDREGLGRRLLVAILALCTSLGVFVVLTESLSLARVQVFKLTVLAAVLLALALGAAADRLLARLGAPSLPRLPGPALLVIGVAGFVLAAALVAFRPQASDPLDAVAAWAREATPRDAVFVVPPSSTGFRIASNRAVVATWKATPFRADLAGHWLGRLGAMTGSNLTRLSPAAGGTVERLDRLYARPDDGRWPALRERFGADFAVVPAGSEGDMPVAHRAGPWTILDLRQP